MVMMMRMTESVVDTGGWRSESLSDGGSGLGIFLGVGSLDNYVAGKDLDLIVRHESRSHVNDCPIGILEGNVGADERP